MLLRFQLCTARRAGASESSEGCEVKSVTLQTVKLQLSPDPFTVLKAPPVTVREEDMRTTQRSGETLAF